MKIENKLGLFDWKLIPLYKTGQIITGRTPSSSNPEHFDNGVLFVTPSDFKNFSKYVNKTVREISAQGKEFLYKNVIPKNSVLVTCIGSDMGKVAINKKECITNQQINSIILNKNFDCEFIYYLLVNNYSTLRLLATSGSTMPIINKTEFGNIHLAFPGIDEQRAIASILSSFDDKIELLEKQNETLEKIGEALFKHWFVDFEFPDEQGKPYKSSGGKMVYNEELKKEIPDGWKVSKIGDKLKTVLGGTPSRNINEYWGGKVPWINSGAINDFPVINASEYISEAGLKNSATQLMAKGTVVLPFVISVDKEVVISVLAKECAGNQSVLGILHNEEFSTGFIYYWTQLQKERIYSSATGGAQQHINKRNIDLTELIIPNNTVLHEYNSIVKIMFEKIYSNTFEIVNLKHTRDLLLPKLMSGKIRVI